MSSSIQFVALYTKQVEKGSVPAPLNLVQFVRCLPAVCRDRPTASVTAAAG